MSRPRRRLLILAVLIAGVCILGGAVRVYLTSRHVTSLVATRLQEAYGARVEVAEVDIGLRTAGLRNLKVFEADEEAADQPWLEIGDVAADTGAP